MTRAFIGYGELGRQINAFIAITNTVVDVIFFDDNMLKTGPPFSFPFATFAEDRFSDHSFFVSLGYKQLQRKNEILQQLVQLNRHIFSCIHPSGFISSTVNIGLGVAVYPMCNVDKDVILGDGVLLNNSVTVSHNSIIGNCAYISPGVVISGNVKVGENTFIGSGTVVANDINIGKNVVIGAGSVITKDIPDHSFVIGNPLKFTDKLNLI